MYLSVQPPAGRLLTCIFTDIVNSTAMWGISEPATSQAINIHDMIIRRSLASHRGSEVKNLGDGFFCVFASARDALRFCLESQRALQYAIWPAEIMAYRARLDVENPSDPTLNFRGVTVRMGIHYGKLFSEAVDPVHGRLDYNGIVGCVASRVHQLADGDEIALSDAFICALYSEETNRAARIADLDDRSRARILSHHVPASQFGVKSLGEQNLRGVPQSETITVICLRRQRGFGQQGCDTGDWMSMGA